MKKYKKDTEEFFETLGVDKKTSNGSIKAEVWGFSHRSKVSTKLKANCLFEDKDESNDDLTKGDKNGRSDGYEFF